MNISQCLEELFRPDGRMIGLGFAHRPQQLQFARILGRHFDTTAVSNDAAAIETPEVGTGIGKTLPYVIAGGLLKRIYNQRLMVTTYTRALREDIIELEDTVNASLAFFDFEPIKIGAVRSVTSVISRLNMEALERSYDRSSDYYQNVIDLLQAVTAAEDSGKVFTFEDWYEQGGDFDFYTIGRGIDPKNKVLPNLAVTALEFKNNIAQKNPNPAFVSFDAENKSALDADLLAVTHSLFVINGASFGTILNTNRKTSKQTSHVIIDEADQYGHQTSTGHDSRVTMESIRDLYRLADRRITKKANKAIANFETFAKIKLHSLDRILLDNSGDRDDLIKVGEIIDRLAQAITEDFHSKYVGQPVFDFAYLICKSLGSMQLWIENIDDTSNLDIRQMDDSNMELAITHPRNGLLALVFEARSPRQRVNKMWRNRNTHDVKSFMFLSGTLLDYTTKLAATEYCKLVGLGKSENLKPPVKIPTTGQAQRVVFCPSTPAPFSGVEVTAATETDTSHYPLSEAYLDAIAKIIRAETVKEKALILVQSYAELGGLQDRLGDLEIQFQNRGEFSGQFVHRLRKQSDTTSALCLFWSGVNFTSTNRETIYRRLIIPRLPIGSPKLRGFEDVHQIETFWKMRQAFGRLFRRPENQDGDIWICDSRYNPDGRIRHELGVEFGKRGYPTLLDDILVRDVTKLAVYDGEKITKEVIYI